MCAGKIMVTLVLTIFFEVHCVQDYKSSILNDTEYSIGWMTATWIAQRREGWRQRSFRPMMSSSIMTAREAILPRFDVCAAHTMAKSRVSGFCTAHKNLFQGWIVRRVVFVRSLNGCAKSSAGLG